MTESSDLVYYGKFTLDDVDKMVPLDRNQYTYLTKERLESNAETLGAISLLL